jgi:hypothetical protein
VRRLPNLVKLCIPPEKKVPYRTEVRRKTDES